MNKLLALSIALLSVSLYGADKTPDELRKKIQENITEELLGPKDSIFSHHGLEGFGKHGIQIQVDRLIVDFKYADKFKPDYQLCIDTIELALRRAGLDVVKEGIHTITISAEPRVEGGEFENNKRVSGKLIEHLLILKVERYFTFTNDGKTYRHKADCLSGLLSEKDRPFDKRGETIEAMILGFIDIWRKANPKKEDKK